MSFVGNEYKKELDRKCAEDINITAQDILVKAGITDVTPLPFGSDSVVPAASANKVKNKIKNDVDVKDGSKRRTKAKTQRLIRQTIAIAAALLIIFGLGGFLIAGIRGFGPFAGRLHPSGSEPGTTITPVEAVCLYDIGTTHHVNGFDITFEGLTGYIGSPLLQFSIRTDDEQFCSNFQTIDLTVYPAIEENKYDTNKPQEFMIDNEKVYSIHPDDRCMYKIATATQDSSDPHLYMASVLAKPDDMASGKEFVVAVRSIRTGVKTGHNSEGRLERKFKNEILIDAEWRLSFPQYDESVIRNTCAIYMDDSRPDVDAHVKGGESYDTKLYYTQFFINYTELVLEYSIASDEDDFFENYSDYYDKICSVTKDSKLIVDGVEYEYYLDPFIAWESPSNKSIIVFTFPSVYYEKAQSIVYVCGDTSIVIK
ncbi:MAG: hypothetical protein MJ084_03590 [Saccharofermentans sp.]|nr:hypothetical protein [Saccharofermentans sp.]